RAQTGHAQSSDGEILMVGVNLELNRSRERHFVLLVIGSDDSLQFGFKIRLQKRGFLLAQLEDSGGSTVSVELGIAVQQAQRIHSLRTPVLVGVAFLELFAGFVLLAESHQVDT